MKNANTVKFIVPVGLIGTFVLTSSDGAQGPPPVGGPLPGLTQAELQRFDAGRAEFLQNENVQTGLGPVFNEISCVRCHAAGAPGGASPNNTGTVVTRIGANVNTVYSDLPTVGGALLQRRSLREIIPTYPIFGEVTPPEAQFVSRRQTTPVFGIGLMEAIPAATILTREDPTDVDRNGISGRANYAFNPVTRVTELGRFGWKSQLSSVHVFAADAYLNEMGITNPVFPREVLPQGRPIPPGADTVADPEDRTGAGVARLTDFMRFMNAPPTTPGSATGRALFASVGCVSCHTPTMTTGANPIAALANKNVNLYSDLLLHDMGTGLADNIRQGRALGYEFRTAPLWGLRFRQFFLHDARATSPDQAIRLHGGEAARSVTNYNALTPAQRTDLINFILSL